MARKTEPRHMNFSVIPLAAIPRSRDSKHRDLTLRILADLAKLRRGSALKIAISELGTGLANARAALSRACNALGLKVQTSADAEYLYIWLKGGPKRNVPPKMGA